MPMAFAMAEQADEPEAPIAKDAIDPELVKLRRPPPKIGMLTAAGVVFLCGYFLLALGPDRRFAGRGEAPARASIADIAAGKLGDDAFVEVDAELHISQAIRVATQRGGLGMRVAPVRGSQDKLWIVLSGDGWDPPAPSAYAGRLRPLDELPLAPALSEHAAAHPRPRFALASAVRAGFATGKITGVDGDVLVPRDGDRVGFDVTDPDAAVLVAALNPRLPTVAAWTQALADAGIALTGPPPAEPPPSSQAATLTVRFELRAPGVLASLPRMLEQHELWAARVEPVVTHHETTWGALKASGPTGFTVGGTTIPDTQLDLVGVYIARGIPSGAHALLTGERPQDYWYVLPVTIVVGVILLLFAWGFVRAVKRDLLPART
jgi:hypothetical protein